MEDQIIEMVGSVPDKQIRNKVGRLAEKTVLGLLIGAEDITNKIPFHWDWYSMIDPAYVYFWDKQGHACRIKRKVIEDEKRTEHSEWSKLLIQRETKEANRKPKSHRKFKGAGSSGTTTIR